MSWSLASGAWSPLYRRQRSATTSFWESSEVSAVLVERRSFVALLNPDLAMMVDGSASEYKTPMLIALIPPLLVAIVYHRIPSARRFLG